MIPAILALSLLGCLFILLQKIYRNRKGGADLTVSEYWVFVTQDRLPEERRIMESVLRDNPHNSPGKAAISPPEGMLFSDIRLHLGLAKRDKNPHIFRPDLVDENAVPRKTVLEGLADAKAMIKVRFLSETKTLDMRHLRFVPHVAGAVCRIAGGTVVFDHVMEVFWTAEEFAEELNRMDADESNFHARIIWKHGPDGAYAQTLGLRKVGRSELRTEPQEEDHEVLATKILEQAANQIIADPDNKGPYEYESFGDAFQVQLAVIKDGAQNVIIQRRHALP